MKYFSIAFSIAAIITLIVWSIFVILIILYPKNSTYAADMSSPSPDIKDPFSTIYSIKQNVETYMNAAKKNSNDNPFRIRPSPPIVNKQQQQKIQQQEQYQE